MNKQPWTYTKLTTQMNRAGWRAMGQGEYKHESGESIYLWGYTQERGVEWQYWADRHETPEVTFTPDTA